jgi:citrate lyase beta subunit
MRKIKETPVDGVILDLEDAVAPDSKAQVCVARSGTLADKCVVSVAAGCRHEPMS